MPSSALLRGFSRPPPPPSDRPHRNLRVSRSESGSRRSDGHQCFLFLLCGTEIQSDRPQTSDFFVAPSPLPLCQGDGRAKPSSIHSPGHRGVLASSVHHVLRPPDSAEPFPVLSQHERPDDERDELDGVDHHHAAHSRPQRQRKLAPFGDGPRHRHGRGPPAQAKARCRRCRRQRAEESPRRGPQIGY